MLIFENCAITHMHTKIQTHCMIIEPWEHTSTQKRIQTACL